MAKFIECKWTSDESVWIAVDRVVAILPRNGKNGIVGTRIFVGGGEDDNFPVEDLPEAVLQKLNLA